MGTEYPWTESWSDDRVSVRVTRPVRGVVQTLATGFATIAGAARLVRWVDGAIADGESPLVFHDWYEITGYEPAVRRTLAAWYVRVFGQVRGVHVLSSSKIVAMGVSLVSVAMNNAIVAYPERASFELALARAVRAAQSER